LLDLANSNAQSSSNTAICTLFEGDYHLGLAAFVNSLVHVGFTGTIWAGYKGSLPPWLHQLQRLDTQRDECMVTEQVRLVFLPLETDLNLTNYKPKFMLDLFSDQAPDCQYLWYFDPDIFLRFSWSYFANWQRHGIALCQEIVHLNLPATDPLRLQWMDIGNKIGLGQPRPLSYYFNGGMVGVSVEHESFLRLWARLIEYAGTTECDLKRFQQDASRELPFAASDQDALNMAAMYSEHPLTVAGPEAMGFVHGKVIMYHTVGPKPWRGSLVLRALAGTQPTAAIKYFFTQVSSPIRAYTRVQLRAKLFGCAIAALIGRFYRRG
jgi:hypothetical protein